MRALSAFSSAVVHPTKLWMKKARLSEDTFRYRGLSVAIPEELAVDSAGCKFQSLLKSDDFYTIAGSRDVDPNMAKGKVAFFLQSSTAPPVFRCVGLSRGEHSAAPDHLDMEETELPLDRVFFETFQGECHPETYTIQDLTRRRFNMVREVDFSHPISVEMARNSEMFGICNITTIQKESGPQIVVLKYEYPNDRLIFLENMYHEKLVEMREKTKNEKWLPEDPKLETNPEIFLQYAHLFFGDRTSLIKYLIRVLRDPKHPHNEAFLKEGI